MHDSMLLIFFVNMSTVNERKCIIALCLSSINCKAISITFISWFLYGIIACECNVERIAKEKSPAIYTPAIYTRKTMTVKQ